MKYFYWFKYNPLLTILHALKFFLQTFCEGATHFNQVVGQELMLPGLVTNLAQDLPAMSATSVIFFSKKSRLAK